MHCLSKYSTLCVLLILSGFIFLISPVIAQEQAPLKSGASKIAVTDTLGKVREKLSELLGLNFDELLPKTDLVADLGIDRTSLYYKLHLLYDTFNTKPPVEQLTVVAKIAQYIDENKKAKKAKRPAVMMDMARAVGGDEFFVQKVYFATNRNITGKSDPDDFFGSKPVKSRKLQYGLASVNIPRSHKNGQIESPWLGIKFLRSKSKHIYIDGKLKILDAASFFSSIKSAGASKEPLLVYIHGFNINFSEAVTRAAQIAVDLNFEGVPLAFSWPSNGKANPLAYWSDMADVEISIDYVERFLADLSKKFRGRDIHLIAHSMGTKALTFALRNLARKGQKKPMFKSVILAAPDLDSRLFASSLADDIQPLAEQWAIYASQNDFALNYSGVLSGTPLLGVPLTVVKGMQIIDASKIEVTPWSVPEGHSYYATKKKVIDDMVGVMKGMLPKARGLVAKSHADGLAWEFR